jgi:parallel beta-helix repeat protein
LRGLEKKAASGITLVLLLTVLALVSFSSLLLAQPSEGDWIVTGVKVVENKTVLLNGNLTVKAGGSLTLRNVTLRMNVEQNGQYGISVEEGGSLSIYDSNISSTTEFRFFFSVVGGSFVMKNSELHDAGWDGQWDWNGEPSKRGLYVQADDAVIDGNFISDSLGVFLCLSRNSSVANNRLITDHGITISHNVPPYQPIPRDNSILNNTIQGSLENGITITCNSNIVANNTILDTMVGIMLMESWDNVVCDNYVVPGRQHDPWGGIVLWEWCGNNTISNNTIRQEESFLFLTNAIDGIEVVRSVNNRIEGNVVENVQGGITLSYAHKNVVASNNISNIRGGVSLTFSNAIQLYQSSDNAIINNHISKVESNAILLWDMSMNNVLQANVINSSYNGISLHYSSDNNTIVNNAVSHISSLAILFDESNENVAFDNSFVDPAIESFDNGMNHWNLEGRGNYWGDYEGQDKDGDGIGDTPYDIQTKGMDSFPLINPKLVTFVPTPILEPATPRMWPLDWMKDAVITGEETWKDTAITIAHITVKNGGNLTIQNMTVMLFDGIMVETGGSLYIFNSRITAADPRYGGYSFFVTDAKEFVMKESELNHAGFCFQGDFPGGLSVLTTNTTIENNIFKHNYRAICVGGPSLSTIFSRIANNTISYSYEGVMCSEGYLVNNTISKIVNVAVSAGSPIRVLADNSIFDVWKQAILVCHTYPDKPPAVVNNTISNGEAGILIDRWVNGLSVTGNLFSSLRQFAIQVSESEYESPANIITNNTMLNCAGSIYLAEGSLGTLLYHNNIINSSNSCDYGSNSWDYNGEGNYWSDYAGIDIKCGSSQDLPGSDGIGDTPKLIDIKGADHFPLMYPYGSPPPRKYSLTITSNAEGTTDPAPGTYNYTTNSTVRVKAIPDAGFSFSYWLLDSEIVHESPVTIIMDADQTLIPYFTDMSAPAADAGTDRTVNVGATVNFDAGGSSDNVGIVSYEWDFGDGTTGTGEKTSHTYTNPGTYTVILTVKDAAGNSATRSITITVLSTEAFPPWILGIFAAIAIAAATTLLWRRRKSSFAGAKLKRGSPAKNV